MNRRLLDALACRNEGRPPVWIMRQAGRYMPEYQALRSCHSLWELFHNPELAVQVTHLPLKSLDVDAAILFSDILVVVEALGLEVAFPLEGGPRVEPPLRSASQVDALPILSVEERLSYVFATIRALKKEIAVPLIGFCGGPFTVASYCIDSGSRGGFSLTKKWMEGDPASFHRLLQKITNVTIDYLQAQERAGVDAIQVFDSWLNVLGAQERASFAYPYLQQILRSVSVPVILFCRHSSLFPEELVALAPSCISFDWLQPMHHLRAQVPSTIAVQGNLDPAILRQSKEEITEAVRSLLGSMQGEKGYIANLGHGVLPDIPFDHVRHFVERIKAL